MYKNFWRAERDFVLSLQTLELVQTKNNISLQLDFPLLGHLSS